MTAIDASQCNEIKDFYLFALPPFTSLHRELKKLSKCHKSSKKLNIRISFKLLAESEKKISLYRQMFSNAETSWLLSLKG
jgi:hypothetical protein